VVAIAHNHLLLARDLVEVQLRPWESKHRRMTLQQVRSGINKLLHQLGTPAPQTSRKIERQVCGGNRWQGDAFSCRLQEAKDASTCSILMRI
jgi:hypothetical protein